MTKEEAIKIIEYTFLNADGHLKPLDFDYGGGKGIVEALRMAIEELSQPSLPSDLDEAAIPESEMDEWMKYGPHTNYPWCGIPDAIKITAEHFFALGKQAGAEWMAGQFVLVGGEPTNWFRANDGSEYATGLDLKEPIKLPVDFYVRKK